VGFLSKLLGKAEPLTSAVDEQIATDYALILTPQLDLLGFKPGAVPLHGSTGSRASRAYVVGLAATVVEHYRGQGMSSAEEDNAYTSAILAVYGASNVNAVGALTFAEIKRDEPEAIRGCNMGERDARAFYAGEAMSGPLGFWMLNNGAVPEKVF
jgi:hypothetical protein